MGATPGAACPSCGTELRSDAKFCHECGTKLAQASIAEYKQVTVLFADVVHSMDIAAAVGPERLRELMSQLLDHTSAVVQRYGGAVNQFTGDGIMAIFGAPISLEDHAIRACLAALEIQKQVRGLAAEAKTDGIDLRLRVGLNSGEVIAGEIGSRPTSYTTIGDQVGMAQRMEAAAPPGGIMLSEATARLVGRQAALSERRLVQIKGADHPVPAFELLSVTGRRPETGQRATRFVGRDWELTALSAMLDRAASGRGCVAGVVGPPGIGKSRIVAETTDLAAKRGLPVYSTYCESHTSDVPFQAANRLLRAAWHVEGLDAEAAREVVRSRIPGAHPDDLTLLYDELGLRDSTDRLPEIAPEARRRRLTALVNGSAMARKEPVVYVIEDAHWIDSTSESLLADFLSVIPRAPALVLTTYRPEYNGALSHTAGAQTIALAPLDDLQMTGLVTELLGPDPSVTELGKRVAERASGNPFFAEEIVRDLADRGVLSGERGAYTCADEAADAEVPATVQAAIAARIDRLAADAKLALNAAAVIGLRFDKQLLAELQDNPAVEPLVDAELIDQVAFTPHAEYAFRHPLIRSVAYRSQLATARAELHRRLARVLEARDPASADECAALIAEHLEAAGELAAASSWRMRAGNWLLFRDVTAARLSWQRASHIADRLPAEVAGREAMRIAPRALLCATTFRIGEIDEASFHELCRLADAAGDNVSKAMGMGGHVLTLTFRGRYHEASVLTAELLPLLQSIGDPTVKLMLLPAAACAKLAKGELADLSELVQQMLELADGDPLRGGAVIESPLTLALWFRALTAMCRGAKGWQAEMMSAAEMVREFTPLGEPDVMFWKYGFGVLAGAVRPDAAAIAHTADILAAANQRGDDHLVSSATFSHGFVLAQQPQPIRARGMKLLADVRASNFSRRGFAVVAPLIDTEFAKEKALQGNIDEAIDELRTLAEREVGLNAFGPFGRAAELVVELLLQRDGPQDLAAAQEVIDLVAAVPTEPGIVIYEVALLRLRALVAQARGDEAEYRQYRDRYRAMANEIGYEGHIAIADAMT